jgi:hypothetical protein
LIDLKLMQISMSQGIQKYYKTRHSRILSGPDKQQDVALFEAESGEWAPFKKMTPKETVQEFSERSDFQEIFNYAN